MYPSILITIVLAFQKYYIWYTILFATYTCRLYFLPLDPLVLPLPQFAHPPSAVTGHQLLIR